MTLQEIRKGLTGLCELLKGYRYDCHSYLTSSPPQNPAATYGLWKAEALIRQIDDDEAFAAGKPKCSDARCLRPEGHEGLHGNEHGEWTLL